MRSRVPPSWYLSAPHQSTLEATDFRVRLPPAGSGAIRIMVMLKNLSMDVETEVDLGNKDSRRANAPNGTLRRALVVDDEAAMCSLIEGVLNSADMEAVILGNGVEADDQFREGKFDVILIGLAADSTDGIELVRKIRGAGFNRKTPIIVISGDQRPDALREAFEVGASFFVYKPMDKAHLVRLLRVTQGTIDQE
jgi:two-component system, chemotaxis family, chemotaxis protein CheY